MLLENFLLLAVKHVGIAVQLGCFLEELYLDFANLLQSIQVVGDGKVENNGDGNSANRVKTLWHDTWKVDRSSVDKGFIGNT